MSKCNLNKFQPGDVIHHKRYDYRGVIIGFDLICAADESWYQKNQSQPKRDQPWYHVLVDKATHTTYVAEENLEIDSGKHPVEHPYIKQFFASFYQGKYYKDSVN